MTRAMSSVCYRLRTSDIPLLHPVPDGNSCARRELLSPKGTPGPKGNSCKNVASLLPGTSSSTHLRTYSSEKKKKRKRNMDYAVRTDLQLPLLTSTRHYPGHPLMSAHDCLLSLFQLAWDSTVWTLVCLGDLSDAKWRGSQGLLDRALSFPTECPSEQ